MTHVPELTMRPLPSLDPSNRSMTSHSAINWSACTGNVEDAKLAVQALRSLVDDAVYLDETAYTGAAKIAAYTHKIQAQARRIRELELEVAAVQAEVSAKDRALSDAATRSRELATRAGELQQELDNNTVVFKMHYQELITRNEEISRLNSLVASLQAQLQQPHPQIAQTSATPPQPIAAPTSSHSHAHAAPQPQHHQQPHHTDTATPGHTAAPPALTSHQQPHAQHSMLRVPQGPLLAPPTQQPPQPPPHIHAAPQQPATSQQALAVQPQLRAGPAAEGHLPSSVDAPPLPQHHPQLTEAGPGVGQEQASWEGAWPQQHAQPSLQPQFEDHNQQQQHPSQELPTDDDMFEPWDPSHPDF